MLVFFKPSLLSCCPWSELWTASSTFTCVTPRDLHIADHDGIACLRHGTNEMNAHSYLDSFAFPIYYDYLATMLARSVQQLYFHHTHTHTHTHTPHTHTHTLSHTHTHLSSCKQLRFDRRRGAVASSKGRARRVDRQRRKARWLCVYTPFPHPCHPRVSRGIPGHRYSQVLWSPAAPRENHQGYCWRRHQVVW